MPLTYLNHALREVMLYGNGFEALHRDLLVLLGVDGGLPRRRPGLPLGAPRLSP